MRPRCKKSALKPSSDIYTVVGANREVPFELSSDMEVCLRVRFDALYAPNAMAIKSMAMKKWIMVNLKQRRPRDC